MKLNFTNQNLSQNGEFLAGHSEPSSTLTARKVKSWWQGLCEESREKVCRLYSPDMIAELAEVANNALLACKFHHTYKKKDLISWKKTTNDKEETLTHTYEINLSGKEVLERDLAELFSSFYISIVRDLSPRDSFSNEERPSQEQNRSHIGVKKEKIDFLFDFLTKSLSNFVAGEELVFPREDFWEQYSFIINYTAQQMFSSLVIPSYFKKLLEYLFAYSYILKHQIYLAFYKSTVLATLKCYQEEPQHNENNTNKPTTPLIIKTISQLEKESQGQDHFIDQNSTASGSPRNFATLSSTSENFDLEEMNQKFLARTFHERNASFNRKVFSHQDSAEEAKISAVDDLYFKSQRSSPMPNYYVEPSTENLFDLYQGFFVGNLEITFDPTDIFLVKCEGNIGVYQEVTETPNPEENNELKKEEDGESSEKKEEEQDEEGICTDPLCTQCPLKNNYLPPNPLTMPYPQFPQQQFMNPPEFYSEFYPQQPPETMPCNFGPQIMYMPSANVEPVMLNDPTYETNSYEDYQQMRERPFDPQSGYYNEYQNQGYGSYYKNSYENQFSPMMQGEGKPYYYGKERPRYESKPKLPPRFQRRKENGYRN